MECVPQDTADWLCAECESPITLTAVMREIKQFCKTNVKITHSLNVCHEKIDENNSLVKTLNEKNREMFCES